MYSKSPLKLARSMISVVILALFLCFLTVTTLIMLIDNIYGALFIQFVCAVLFMFFLYCPVWVDADKDRNMANHGKIIFDKFKGIKAGLIIAIPFVILNLLLVLSWLKIIPNFFALYKVINSFFWPLLHILAPNTGSVESLNLFDIIIINLLPLYIPIVTSIGYYCGYKNISLKNKIVYVNNKKS